MYHASSRNQVHRFLKHAATYIRVGQWVNMAKCPTAMFWTHQGGAGVKQVHWICHGVGHRSACPSLKAPFPYWGLKLCESSIRSKNNFWWFHNKSCAIFAGFWPSTSYCIQPFYRFLLQHVRKHLQALRHNKDGCFFHLTGPSKIWHQKACTKKTPCKPAVFFHHQVTL